MICAVQFAQTSCQHFSQSSLVKGGEGSSAKTQLSELVSCVGTDSTVHSTVIAVSAPSLGYCTRTPVYFISFLTITYTSFYGCTFLSLIFILQ